MTKIECKAVRFVNLAGHIERCVRSGHNWISLEASFEEIERILEDLKLEVQTRPRPSLEI